MSLWEISIEVVVGEYSHSDTRRVIADKYEQAKEHLMDELKIYWGDGEGETIWNEEEGAAYDRSGEYSAKYGDAHPCTNEWVLDLNTGKVAELRWATLFQKPEPIGFLESRTKNFMIPLHAYLTPHFERYSEWGFRIVKDGAVVEFHEYPSIDEAVQGMNNILNDEEVGVTVGAFTGPYPVVDGVPFEDWRNEE